MERNRTHFLLSNIIKSGGLMLNTEGIPKTFTPRIKEFNVNPTIVGGRKSKKTSKRSKSKKKSKKK